MDQQNLEKNMQRYADELHELLVVQGGIEKLLLTSGKSEKTNDINHLPISLKTIYRLRKVNWKDLEYLKNKRCSTVDDILISMSYKLISRPVSRLILAYLDKKMIPPNSLTGFSKKIEIDAALLHRYLKSYVEESFPKKGLSVYNILKLAAFFEREKILIPFEEDLGL